MQNKMNFEIFSHDVHLGGVRFFCREDSPAVLCLHGMLENGKIFYSSSGKGLAPWLQKKGYDVFVPDLRGKGMSRPKIRQGLRFSQTDQITKDIPDLMKFVFEQKKSKPFFVMTHSWSGVLLMAALARNEELRPMIRGVVFFGTKRKIRTWSLKRLIELELFWKRLLLGVSFVKGYLPAKSLGAGADDETYLTQKHSVQWVQQDQWVDPVDGTDYGQLIKSFQLPALLSLAGKNDIYLGNPTDCLDFVKELGVDPLVSFRVLGKGSGQLLDYDHISLLTAPEAEEDHFPTVHEWMKSLLS